MNDFQNRPFEILGACFGLGSYEKGGAFGPHAFLSHGLFDALKIVRPDTVLGPILEPVYLTGTKNDSLVKCLPEYLSFHKGMERETQRVYADGRRPLVLGGDHAVSITTISAAARWVRQSLDPNGSVGVLWIDSHPDIHSDESSITKNLHGMPLRVLLGDGDQRLTALNGPKPSLVLENLVYIGIRDVDAAERAYIHEKGIKYYSMRDIDSRGIGPVITEAVQYLHRKVTAVIVSFDLDSCDPFIAPGVGTPVRGGLTEREAHFIMEEIAMIPNLLSVEMVELNPELDKNAETAHLGVRLLASALGKTII